LIVAASDLTPHDRVDVTTERNNIVIESLNDTHMFIDAITSAATLLTVWNHPTRVTTAFTLTSPFLTPAILVSAWSGFTCMYLTQTDTISLPTHRKQD